MAGLLLRVSLPTRGLMTLMRAPLASPRTMQIARLSTHHSGVTSHQVLNMDFVNRAYQLTLPLQSGATLFSLDPAITVRDLVSNVHRDHAVNVALQTPNGVKISPSTPIRHILHAPFLMLVGDHTYHVIPPPPAASSDVSQDISTTLAEIHAAIRSQESQRAAIHTIQNRLEELRTELEPMHELKDKCDTLVTQKTRRWAWLGLVGMGLQFGFLARLTWWEYSWDLMEPVTYFVTYGTQCLFYVYFIMTAREYDYEVAAERFASRRMKAAAAKVGLDLTHYAALQKELSECERELSTAAQKI
eukprot:m.20656 g.20656  ORF g.20656 m.20656 type:complete len:302 (+) comp32190_c0_seq3:44-949(+)